MAEDRHCPECGRELPSDAPQGLCPQCLMKLGLPTGAEPDKTATPDDQSAVATNPTPLARFVPPEAAELAKQFPHLEILELLGQGGMGAVYKARQKQLDRLVALKILPPEVGQTEAFAERFTREARSMAKLNHPRIVSVYDFGHTDQGLYYFIMEFVDGTDLRRVIQAGELAPQEALAIVPQICEALQYAHEEGIVHRDIKPENIMLDKKGRVKITDFGLAKLLDRPPSTYTLTQAGHGMGTPHYMAPEQIEHPHEVDHRADIYSLGVVFYEMLTGQLPIGRFPPPSQKVQVDVRLDKVVLKSLEHEPERRYQHASEVKTDVETIAAEPSMPEAVPSAAAVSAAVPPATLWGIAIQEHVKLVAIIRIIWFAVQISISVFAGSVSIGRLGLLLSVPGLIAGVGLLNRRPWARILALVTVVLDLAVIPISLTTGAYLLIPFPPVIAIYTIWILTKPETRRLFAPAPAAEKPQQLAEARAQQPPLQKRFSRAAIVGVCWAPFFFLLLIPVAIFLMAVYRVTGPDTAPTPKAGVSFVALIVTVPFLLLGLSSAFGTTILGFISISHIRHSAGRLYGMGLALFDALLFPLIILDLVIFVFFTRLFYIPAVLPLSAISFSLLIALPLCALIDYLIIRRAWRKANEGLQPPRSDQTVRPPQTRQIRRGLLVAIIVIAIGLFIGALALTPLLSVLGVRRKTTRPAPRTSYKSDSGSQMIGELHFPQGTPGSVGFGPEGPVLSDQCTRVLELEPSQVLAVSNILQTTYAQYLELERRHAVLSHTIDNVAVTISPFRQEAERLLQQLWDDLDNVLDEHKRTLARRHLPLGQIFGPLYFGGPTVTIAISKQNDMFFYATKYKWPEESRKTSGGGSGRGTVLPPELQRFWSQPVTDH